MSETDEEASPAPLPAPLPAAAPVHAPLAVRETRGRRNFWPVLGILAFLLLAAGEAWLFRLHQLIPDHTTDIAVLQAQVQGLQQYNTKAQPAPDSVAVQADLAQKFADLNAQVTALLEQSAADHSTLQTLAANSSDLTKLTARMKLLGQLETARMALDAGQPIGDIPNVAPALGKYAQNSPPTQAQLVLTYPAAERAANLASIERVKGTSYWSRVVARLESLITITNGAKVLIGPPAAGITAAAQVLLDAGDLNGAVAELGQLSLPTQAAMGTWLSQARSLLAARSALIAMAGQG